MLVNLSNHSSATIWSEEQKRAAAEQYGEVVDMPFPALSADTNLEEVEKMADECLQRILVMKPDAVFVVGEYVFVYQMVRRLLDAGIPALASRGRRRKKEISNDGLSTKSISEFKFECFVPYGIPSKARACE